MQPESEQHPHPALSDRLPADFPHLSGQKHLFHTLPDRHPVLFGHQPTPVSRPPRLFFRPHIPSDHLHRSVFRLRTPLHRLLTAFLHRPAPAHRLPPLFSHPPVSALLPHKPARNEFHSVRQQFPPDGRLPEQPHHHIHRKRYLAPAPLPPVHRLPCSNPYQMLPAARS